MINIILSMLYSFIFISLQQPMIPKATQKNIKCTKLYNLQKDTKFA